MEDCSVCCETFNKTTRRQVDCNHCGYSVCLTCFKRYLLDLQKPANCMNCKNELIMDFIVSNTPNVFYNGEYRKKRALDLLSQEKSLLPATQELVERKKQDREKQKLLNELKEEETYLRARLREIAQAKNDIRYGNQSSTKQEKKEFIMGCTNGNCRGFL